MISPLELFLYIRMIIYIYIYPLTAGTAPPSMAQILGMLGHHFQANGWSC